MLAVRYAKTSPDKLAERQTWLAQHQSYLRSGAVDIVQSGPLSHDDGTPAGGLLIANVESLDDLRRFSDADPFVLHGVYHQIQIMRWNRTIG
ncbi:YciI family protein [Lichenifustis flavocetrariae]|uniref:YciI family protein n=1 Tax=Lichenifustis flavocetrariae TaxID=2949735 RepID=A0AA42CND2_9HYPH|nr:YciI family protein [Lichenifustis flavocetrariae]MCW6509260.1 YciI family protein [Lichenifustis flavocetrariae]